MYFYACFWLFVWSLNLQESNLMWHSTIGTYLKPWKTSTRDGSALISCMRNVANNFRRDFQYSYYDSWYEKKNTYIRFTCVTERTLQLMPRLAFRNLGTGWSTGSHLTSHIHLLHKDMMLDYKHPDGALFSFTCFVGQGTLLPNRTLLLTMSYLLMQQ
jgi:hypothetical protein